MSSTVLKLLPNSMWLGLKQLPRFDRVKVMLLTRHSIRFEATDGKIAGYDLALTEQGRTLAQAWGQYLMDHTSQALGMTLSSPIQRCVDTAQLMHMGHTQQEHLLFHEPSSLLKLEPILVEPGSFVTDIQQAAPHFKQMGAVGFISHFVQGQLPGMKQPHVGVRDILKRLFLHQPLDGQLGLAVSHDTILAALLAVIEQRNGVSAQDWPEMMEGVFLWFEGEDFEHSILHWVWRGEYHQRAMSELKDKETFILPE